MRRSAESGSPWLPVDSATTRSSGKSWISFGGIRIPSGADAIPRLLAMLKFLRIERPTRATLRSSWAAASITCWRRCTLEAKLVITILPSQREKASTNAGPPPLGEPRGVGGLPVHRRLGELVVARQQDGAVRRADRHRPRIRDRVR